jgi:hypothetical protein
VAEGSSHRCRSLAKRQSVSPEKRGLCTTNCILRVISHVTFTRSRINILTGRHSCVRPNSKINHRRGNALVVQLVALPSLM